MFKADSTLFETSGRSSKNKVNPVKTKNRPALTSTFPVLTRKKTYQRKGRKYYYVDGGEYHNKKAVNVMVKPESSSVQGSSYACAGENINECSYCHYYKEVAAN